MTMTCFLSLWSGVANSSGLPRAVLFLAPKVPCWMVGPWRVAFSGKLNK